MTSLVDPLDLPSGVRLPHRVAKAALSDRPNLWRPVSSMRGLIGPALDSRFSRDRRILDVLARLDARLSTSPSATPAAPSRRKKS